MRAESSLSASALVEANKKIDWSSLVVALKEVGAEFSDAAVEAMKSLDATFEGTRARRGAIGPLVTILWDGSWNAKEQAARAVRSLASTDENRVMMAKAGMIDAIVSLLREGPREGAEAACAALDMLALNEDNQVAIASLGAIEPLVFVVERGTQEGAASAARALWNLAANEENQTTIAASNAVPPLVELLSYGNADGVEAAAWALRNLAANADNQLTIAQAGALEVLAEVLGGEDKVGCREAAAGCLRNLALNGPGAQKAIAEVRERLLRPAAPPTSHACGPRRVPIMTQSCPISSPLIQLGVIPNLIDLLDDASMDGREEAAGALRNLAWKDPLIGVRVRPKQSGGAQAHLDCRGAASLRGHTCCSELLPQGRRAEGGATQAVFHCPHQFLILPQAEIVKAGALEPLTDALREGTLPCKEECARCIENLAVDVETAALIIAAGAIPGLVALLYEEGSTSAREAAAGCLWHLAINSHAQMLMSKSGAVRPLVGMLSEGNQFGREEAARCLWYMALNNPSAQSEIEKTGAIKPLMQMLRNTEAEQEVRGQLSGSGGSGPRQHLRVHAASSFPASFFLI